VGKAAPAAAAMQMSENSHKFLIGFQVLVVCMRLDSYRTVLPVKPNMFRGSLSPPHNADLETAPRLQKRPEFISMQKLICW